jgi:NAD-dependent dihydropyrimidine dehydrogenase PreA subunit
MSARRDPSLQRIASRPALQIIACYPRAVRWLFVEAGAPLRPEGVEILNMRTSHATALEHAILDGSPPNGPEPHILADVLRDIEAPDPEGWKPWFPLIDYDRCTHCMECLSFCLFDVYAVSPEGKIEVQNPAKCKSDCPACSRVCPEIAIIFPKHHAAPIHGGEVGPDDLKRDAIKVDVSALLGGDIYGTLRNRSARARRFATDRDEEESFEMRRSRLAQLARQLEIPDEVLAALPSHHAAPRSAATPEPPQAGRESETGEN